MDPGERVPNVIVPRLLTPSRLIIPPKRTPRNAKIPSQPLKHLRTLLHPVLIRPSLTVIPTDLLCLILLNLDHIRLLTPVPVVIPSSGAVGCAVTTPGDAESLSADSVHEGVGNLDALVLPVDSLASAKGGLEVQPAAVDLVPDLLVEPFVEEDQTGHILDSRLAQADNFG